MELFRRFNEVGVTVLVATHDRRLVQALGRRELRLEQGRMTDGDAADPPTASGDEPITIHGPAFDRTLADGPLDP